MHPRIGVILSILALIPLLAGVLPFKLPAFLFLKATIAIWIVTIFALILIFVTAITQDDALMWTFIVAGIIFAGLGTLSILSSFKVIGFSLPLPGIFWYIFLLVEGMGFIVDTFGSK